MSEGIFQANSPANVTLIPQTNMHGQETASNYDIADAPNERGSADDVLV